MLKRWQAALAVAATLAGAYLAAGPSDSRTLDYASLELVGRGQDLGGGRIQFTLSGRAIKGLYPGATTQMKLTVTNPYGFRLQLQHLSSRVTKSSRPGCAPTSINLTTGDYRGRLPITIGAHDRATLPGSIPVSMPSGASVKCAGSRFTITLSGLASRVDR